jgi:hypothetical protein
MDDKERKTREDLAVPMPTARDWDLLMRQCGTPREHEEMLNNWLNNIVRYQERVLAHDTTKHAFYLGVHTSEMLKLVLNVGGRLHKQFAIMMFHYCSLHTQAALPPHVKLFFNLIGNDVDWWLMGLQQGGVPFSTSMTDTRDEFLLGVKVETFAAHLINRVYWQTYHRFLAAQSSSQNGVVRQ